MKILKFSTKNALFGYLWDEILEGILKFVKNEFLTHRANFSIGSAFSKVSRSAFSEGPDPVPGPLFKVCPSLDLN